MYRSSSKDVQKFTKRCAEVRQKMRRSLPKDAQEFTKRCARVHQKMRKSLPKDAQELHSFYFIGNLQDRTL